MSGTRVHLRGRGTSTRWGLMGESLEATELDIQEGRSNTKDPDGNDKADTNADKGVRMINGAGLVKLGSWIDKKHRKYIKFMSRVRKVIIAVTLAEKDERENARAVDKAVQGYDPKVWMKTTAGVRNKDDQICDVKEIALAPPARGKHRFAHCQQNYLDIHKFMANRQWAPTLKESTTSGITWLELFILFDTTGARTKHGEHIKDAEAAVRAEKEEPKPKSKERRAMQAKPMQSSCPPSTRSLPGSKLS